MSFTILRNRYCGCLFCWLRDEGGKGLVWPGGSFTFPGRASVYRTLQKCVRTVCVWFAQACYTGLHNEDIFLCLRIISECLQKPSPKSVTGSTVAAVATPSIMGGTTDRPAQLVRPVQKESYCYRRERGTQYSLHYHFKLFPRIEDICMAKSSLPVQGKGAVMGNVWRWLRHEVSPSVRFLTQCLQSFCFQFFCLRSF